MEKFEINILGCGSALSATKHCLSSQVIYFRERLYMIDCGEGSQVQFRKMKLKFQQLDNIFISHLHGDHCFGLLGLVSVLSLLKRTDDLHIYAGTDAKCLFSPFIHFFCKKLPFRIIFHFFDTSENSLIFEDEILRVFTIPLKHRIPTVGFLLEEKLCKFYSYKIGENFVFSENGIISNNHLTELAKIPRKYAYCSDTSYHEKIISLIDGVDLLYHDSTFSHTDLVRAKKTYHSSAKQAASIAKAAHVKRLVLGHFSNRYIDETILLIEAQKIFINTILAIDQMILKI